MTHKPQWKLCRVNLNEVVLVTKKQGRDVFAVFEGLAIPTAGPEKAVQGMARRSFRAPPLPNQLGNRDGREHIKTIHRFIGQEKTCLPRREKLRLYHPSPPFQLCPGASNRFCLAGYSAVDAPRERSPRPLAIGHSTVAPSGRTKWRIARPPQR